MRRYGSLININPSDMNIVHTCVVTRQLSEKAIISAWLQIEQRDFFFSFYATVPTGNSFIR